MGAALPGKPWLRPVILKIDGDDTRYVIGNSREANQFLHNHWPTAGGEAFDEALAICRKVMEGEMGPEAARAAFIKAAKEAAIGISG
jgi:hypothetical protein